MASSKHNVNGLSTTPKSFENLFNILPETIVLKLLVLYLWLIRGNHLAFLFTWWVIMEKGWVGMNNSFKSAIVNSFRTLISTDSEEGISWNDGYNDTKY